VKCRPCEQESGKNDTSRDLAVRVRIKKYDLAPKTQSLLTETRNPVLGPAAVGPVLSGRAGMEPAFAAASALHTSPACPASPFCPNEPSSARQWACG